MDDRARFEQAVQEHHPAVMRTLLRLTGRRDDVEDLAQEVFLRLYRALPGFRGEATLSTYLYRITVNVAQDTWKRRRRLERPLEPLSDDEKGWEDRLAHPDRNAEEQMSDRELEMFVNEQMEHLSEMERSVLVLCHQEELSYEQISLVLGMPINTVRTHLHRGRNKLRSALKSLSVAREAS